MTLSAFSSRAHSTSKLNRTFRKHPAYFGVPFLLIIVAASFGLKEFTQTRYDLQAQKVSQISKEEELGLTKRRKKFDIREEYFRLQAAGDRDWEPKRIQRPAGLPEWGVAPSEPPPRRDNNP